MTRDWPCDHSPRCPDDEQCRQVRWDDEQERRADTEREEQW